MRKATCAGLVFVVCGYAATAQLTLTPKAGIESAKTCLSDYAGGRSGAAGSIAPQVALRIDYLFHNSHGPFAGLATNRSQVGYSYVDANTGYNKITTSDTKMQLRLEGGYMANTQPLKISNSYTVRIQPFAGLAFVPNPQNTVTNESTGALYRLNAGNWNSAFITGAGFEVGKGGSRQFVLGVQYLNGLNNTESEAFVAGQEAIVSTTPVRSRMSAFNVTIGIPFALTKAKAKKSPEVKKEEEPKKSCSYYRSRCGKWQ